MATFLCSASLTPFLQMSSNTETFDTQKAVYGFFVPYLFIHTQNYLVAMNRKHWVLCTLYEPAAVDQISETSSP